jgi:hypothetical protein
MKTFAHALVAAVAALAVTSIQAQKICTGPTCSVDVVMNGDCGSGIVVLPDPLHIKADGAVTIVWTLKDDTWSFDGDKGDKGITVQLSPGDFSTKPSEPRKFTLQTLPAKVKGKAYKYDVNLSRGTQKCKLDPTIVNH